METLYIKQENKSGWKGDFFVPSPPTPFPQFSICTEYAHLNFSISEISIIPEFTKDIQSIFHQIKSRRTALVQNRLNMIY